MILVAMAALLFLFGSMIVSRESKASCVCACVDGEMRALCTSTLDLEPFCMGICPLTNPSIKPLDSLELPPLGTTNCTNRQVYNSWTKKYEWERVCQ